MPLKTENLLSLEDCPCAQAFLGLKYPWEILAKVPALIEEILLSNPKKYEQIAEGVWVGQGTEISDTARFKAPVLIGAGCEIWPNAYLRQNTIIGDHAVVGTASEVKHAILFNEVKIAHFNYVGDSVLGRGVHLGAGAIISNFRSLPGTVNVVIGEEVIETGLRKLGAIMGDGAEVGCNAVLNPGSIIGRGAVVYPLSSFRGYIPPRTIYKGPGELVPLRD